MSNIESAKAVADAVRTSLGPRGMDKMVRVYRVLMRKEQGCNGSHAPSNGVHAAGGLRRCAKRTARSSSQMTEPQFWTKCQYSSQPRRCSSSCPSHRQATCSTCCTRREWLPWAAMVEAWNARAGHCSGRRHDQRGGAMRRSAQEMPDAARARSASDAHFRRLQPSRRPGGEGAALVVAPCVCLNARYLLQQADVRPAACRCWIPYRYQSTWTTNLRCWRPPTRACLPMYCWTCDSSYRCGLPARLLLCRAGP